MIKVKMLTTQFASDEEPNGATMRPKHYEAGKEYVVGPRLGRAFVDEMKCAERVGQNAPDAGAKNGAPENKMLPVSTDQVTGDGQGQALPPISDPATVQTDPAKPMSKAEKRAAKAAAKAQPKQ